MAWYPPWRSGPPWCRRGGNWELKCIRASHLQRHISSFRLELPPCTAKTLQAVVSHGGMSCPAWPFFAMAGYTARIASLSFQCCYGTHGDVSECHILHNASIWLPCSYQCIRKLLACRILWPQWQSKLEICQSSVNITSNIESARNCERKINSTEKCILS